MSSGGSGREGGWALKTRVRTVRKRSLSSTLWLERQLNDPYVAQARREGYRSRAAYKLLEIDEKYKLFKRGQRILELGAAPGGWSQVAAARTGASEGRGKVIAIDLLEMDLIEGVEFAAMDFHDADATERLRGRLGGLVDGVLSDMAANATGHRKTDHLRIVGLVELAADFAFEVLAPGGFFLAKVLQGGTEGELLARLKREFAAVRHVKPKASRADSAELYLLATGFRGRGPALATQPQRRSGSSKRSRRSAAAVARSSLVGTIRPDSAAPASGLRVAKMKVDRLETIATRTKASERSRA